MTERAVDTYQTHLDVSTRHVIKGDAEAYCAHAQLPFVFRTAEGIEVIETFQDLCGDIRQIHAWLRSQNVSDYHRIAREARFLDDDTIEGFHTTYALRGAVPVVEPYLNRMILKRGDGMWKTSYAEHELVDALYPGHDARARHGLFSEQWSISAPDLAPEHRDPRETYQSVIDNIADASIRNDFAKLAGLYAFPYDVHFDQGSYTVDEPEGMHRFNDTLQEMIRETRADRLLLQATFAVYLSEDSLLGYHDARLMRGDTCCFGPLRSRLLLTNENGPWQVKTISDAISTTGWNEGRMIISPDLPTMREIQKRTKT